MFCCSSMDVFRGSETRRGVGGGGSGGGELMVGGFGEWR